MAELRLRLSALGGRDSDESDGVLCHGVVEKYASNAASVGSCLVQMMCKLLVVSAGGFYVRARG